MTQFAAVQTVVDAIVFGFKRLLTTLKLTWLPILAIVALGVLAFSNLYGPDFISNLESDDPETILRLVFTIYPLIFLGLLLFIPAYVALMRIAAGDIEVPGGIAYFKWGSREWRVLGASLVLFVMFMALYMLMGVIGIAIAAAAVTVNETAMAFVVGIGIVIVVCFFIWFFTRLMTFIPKAAIENRIAFGDAFGETKGNFWKLLFSYILFNLMQQVVATVVMFILFIPAIIMGVGLSTGIEQMSETQILSAVSPIVAFVGIGYFAMVLYSIASASGFSGMVHAQLASKE